MTNGMGLQERRGKGAVVAEFGWFNNNGANLVCEMLFKRPHSKGERYGEHQKYVNLSYSCLAWRLLRGSSLN